MTPEKLADRIVGYGIGTLIYNSYFIGEEGLCPETFVNDPRVAMAMLEELEHRGWSCLIDMQPGKYVVVRCGKWDGETCCTENTKGVGKSAHLPRAIIEAADKALRDG